MLQNQYCTESTDIHQTLQLMKLCYSSHYQPKKSQLWSALAMGTIQYFHHIVSECCTERHTNIAIYRYVHKCKTMHYVTFSFMHGVTSGKAFYVYIVIATFSCVNYLIKFSYSQLYSMYLIHLRWHSSFSAKVTKNANLGYSHDRGLS